MSRPPAIPVELAVHSRAGFADLGGTVFNVERIVAMTNKTDTTTTVVTATQDFEIDLPLAEAVRILTGGDP